MRFIGDVHGKWDRYKELLTGIDSSVQVGDFGIGFPTYAGISEQPDFIHNTNHKFIRGNHDSLEVCKTQSNWIEDGTITIINGKKIMFVGGAWSIDHAYRTPGVDWWRDEELSYSELHRLINTYVRAAPDIMVTHDLPWDVIPNLITHFSDFHQSRTQNALSAMFAWYKPELWICGHWHTSVDKMIDGTRFKVLNELEYFDLDI